MSEHSSTNLLALRIELFCSDYRLQINLGEEGRGVHRSSVVWM